MQQELCRYLSETYVPFRLSLAENSVEQMAIAIRLFDRWLKRPATLADLTPATVVAWLHWLASSRAPRTVNAKRAAILAIWRDAAENGLCDPPRCIPKMLEPDRIPEAFFLEQLEALLVACRNAPGAWDGCPASLAWQILILVIWDTACRIGSVWGAKLADVDLERGTWFVPAANIKGRRADRLFRLHPDTVSLIRQSVPPERERLFPYPRKKRRIWTDFRELLAEANLPTDRRHLFHCLRRTSESYAAAMRGVSWAAQVVGHSEKVARKHYIAPSIVAADSLCDVLPRPSKPTI